MGSAKALGPGRRNQGPAGSGLGGQRGGHRAGQGSSGRRLGVAVTEVASPLSVLSRRWTQPDCIFYTEDASIAVWKMEGRAARMEAGKALSQGHR